jgi:hypothetical protein
MQIDDTMFIDEPRTNTSARRYQAVQGDLDSDQRREAQAILNNINIGTRRASRAAASSVAASNRKQQGRRSAQEPAPRTDEDPALEIDLPRTQALPVQMLRKPQRPRFHGHPLFWIGLTLICVWLLWTASTNGVAFVVTHAYDPGTYGPTHGNVITGIFGGGDSQAAPSKLIGLNDGGHTEIIYIHADNPAKSQIISGPDLIASNFPDPQVAEVQLETGDFNHDGHLDVKATILSDVYDWPFHRFQSQSYYLYGDGKGNLKPLPQPQQQTSANPSNRRSEGGVNA